MQETDSNQKWQKDTDEAWNTNPKGQWIGFPSSSLKTPDNPQEREEQIKTEKEWTKTRNRAWIERTKKKRELLNRASQQQR